MNFYSKYLFQCKKKNKSPSAAAVEAGLTKTSVTRWKNGSVPTDANILVLAEYFECSFEDLAPDKEETATPKGSGITVPEDYYLLPPEDRAAVDAMIARLATKSR